jgi:sugar phosphate isomerase/epimerase
MPEVLDMVEFDLVNSSNQRREFRTTAEDVGCGVAIAYPFNLTRSSIFGSFDPALDAAAEIGARAINLLVFDRDLGRRAEAVAALCGRAADRGLAVGLEFYPLSAVRTLDEAIALCAVAAAPNLKLTVDLLHLHRSGGSFDDLRAQRHRILLAQICDAPAAPPDDLFHEAAADRLLPGEGELDLAGFLRACGPDVPVSIEAPCARTRPLSPELRARAARQAALVLLSGLESN